MKYGVQLKFTKSHDQIVKMFTKSLLHLAILES